MEVSELLAIALGGGFSAALVSGIIQLALWRLNRKATKEDAETKGEKDIKAAVRVLLYDRIKHLGRNYIVKGCVSAEDLEDLMSMHKIYHDELDGNGFLDNVMVQVKKLPIRN